nr:hypothetical protein Q903MT_gene6494 [Picea sitchensis]
MHSRGEVHLFVSRSGQSNQSRDQIKRLFRSVRVSRFDVKGRCKGCRAYFYMLPLIGT